MLIVRVNRQFFSDFVERNQQFMKKVHKYHKNFNQHQRVADITQQQADKFVSSISKEEVAARIVNEARYDKQMNDFISDFNQKHRGRVNLLDFSNYATSFGEMKDGPIRKSDLDVIQEFQKRKVDQRIHFLRKEKLEEEGRRRRKSPYEDYSDDPLGHQDNDIYSFTQPDKKVADVYNAGEETTFPPEGQTRLLRKELKQGPFEIRDDFVMLLLHRGVSTKVTTLNRLNYYRTLVFMGNGNGVIAYGKGRSDTPQNSLQKAIDHCKMNLIAIPMDDRCTLPKPIAKRFQDYRLYLRPIPGFNSWGHPTMSSMLALTGFSHLAFKTVHTSKNVYDLCNVFFKTVTKNTTPQELAEHEGYKIYRHQFIRPLTELQTHRDISY